MKVYVQKSDNKESNERLIARFNKKIQGSRKLVKVRDERYMVHKPKKRKVRAAAIMREKYRSLREKNKFY